ncbi:MAG: 5'-3' exonuclease H3TH domain-containing protein, partial [Ekhidna sp.]
MSEKKLFLLDAFALIYRAHFAMSQNPRLTTNGINTGAILGFTNSLLEIITKEKPSHIGVAFDTHAPTFRHEDYAEYKATRQEQPEEIKVAIPYCLKIVEGFNIPILMKDGYEADDLIGTIAKKASKEGFKVYMMTPDKDFAQLVDENIFLFKPRRMGNGVDIMGIPEVLEKFDIDKVDQVRDVLGLKGDSVDNIPGIPGIGDKTASKLLKEYGSVEEIVAHVDELKGALQKRVEEHGQQGIMSKELATIKIDSPIEFDETALQYGEPNPDILQPIFDKLEFKTIARRVFQEENDIKKGETQQLGLFDGGGDAPSVSDNKESIKTTKHTYQLIEGQEAIQQLVKKLSAEKSFCFDTETTSLETREAKLVGIAFAIKKGEAWYVPCGENAQSVADAFKDVLENDEIQKIGQNLKYDIQVMRNYGVNVKGE